MPEFMLWTLAQMLVILVPCYTVAYFIDKMVYLVPTLAAALVMSRAWPLKTDDDHDGERDVAEGDNSGHDVGTDASGGEATGQGA